MKITKIKWPKGLTLEQWGEERKKVEGIGQNFVRIGASDVAATMAASRFKCPARLYAHLCGAHSHFQISQSSAAGHVLEPIIADRFMGYLPDDEEQSLLNWQYGHKLRKIRKANFFVLNSEYPWLSASLDFIPMGKVHSPFTGSLYQPLTPIECKTTNRGYYSQWKDGITYAYLLQVQQQMLLTNTDVCVFNVLIDGSDYKVHEVERDDILCEQIVQETKKFADIVLAGKQAYIGMLEATSDEERHEFQSIYESLMPEPIGLDDDVDFAMEVAIDPDFETKRPATDDESALMQTYLTAKEVIKDMEAEANKSMATLIRNVGEFEEITGETAKFMYRRGRDNKRDYKAIRSI